MWVEAKATSNPSLVGGNTGAAGALHRAAAPATEAGAAADREPKGGCRITGSKCRNRRMRTDEQPRADPRRPVVFSVMVIPPCGTAAGESVLRDVRDVWIALKRRPSALRPVAVILGHLVLLVRKNDGCVGGVDLGYPFLDPEGNSALEVGVDG